jgi:pre-mycofactocin synthase
VIPLEQLREIARRRLPRAVFQAIEAGNGAGVTRADNVAAFAELGLNYPSAAERHQRYASARDLRTTVLGLDLSLPVLASPVGVQAVHPLGEVAVAQGTARAGTALGISEFASRPYADVIAHNDKALIQVHWSLNTSFPPQRFGGLATRPLALTLDWTFSAGRDWGSPRIPERLGPAELARHAPQVLARPRYLARWLAAGRLPDLTVPNMAPPGQPAPGFFEAYRDWARMTPPAWADIQRVRDQWPGPLLIKGVLTPEDARRAVGAGADAISVSNHGGNNLDTTPASIRALPAIVAAVGGQAEVVLDGGIRCGGDVVKALALGARAVMIGRPVLWGLAAGGPAGVARVFEILRGEIDATLRALGRASAAEVCPDDVLIPEGFRV